MAYSAINLGLLPGGLGSAAAGVSSDGAVVVGSTLDSGSVSRAVYWDSGGMHQLPGLGAGGDTASGCSGTGAVIVGTSTDGGGNAHAVTWTGGPGWVVNDLGFLAGGAQSHAYGCSSNGLTIVGSSETGVSSGVACVWTAGVPAALPPAPGTTDGIAFGISRDGTKILGTTDNGGADFTPVSWSGGPGWAVTVLDTLPGGVASGSANFGQASSTSGLVAGTASDSGGNTNAGYWAPTALTTFAGPLGGAGSAAYGIDLTGLVICGVAAGGGATVWTSGVGALLPVIPGGTANQALGVSADGTTIVGVGTDGVHSVAAKWSSSVMPTPASTVRFLVCGPDWTITQPTATVRGLDHLAGSYVIGLADGVLVGPLLVDDDGVATLPFAASAITLGLSFTPQVQTTYLDAGNPTVQSRRKDVVAVTARVRSSLGVQVGSNQPDGATFDPVQNAPTWTGMQAAQLPPLSPSYTSPSGQTVTLPVTGDLRQTVLTEWKTGGQIAIQGTPGLPLYLLAVIPELLSGDEIETAFSKEQQRPRRERTERGARPIPGRWMLSDDH